MAARLIQCVVFLSLSTFVLTLPTSDEDTPIKLCTCTDKQGIFSSTDSNTATLTVCNSLTQLSAKYQNVNAPNGAVFGACTGTGLTLGYEKIWALACTAQGGDGGGCCDRNSNDPNYCHFIDGNGNPTGGP